MVKALAYGPNNAAIQDSSKAGLAVHRLLANWSEGIDDAPAGASSSREEGAVANVGDVTWSHRRYPATEWSTPGGCVVPRAERGWYI